MSVGARQKKRPPFGGPKIRACLLKNHHRIDTQSFDWTIILLKTCRRARIGIRGACVRKTRGRFGKPNRPSGLTMLRGTPIGIGGSLTAPPLPHHRTYGSVSGGSADYVVRGRAVDGRPSEVKKAFGMAKWSAG